MFVAYASVLQHESSFPARMSAYGVFDARMLSIPSDLPDIKVLCLRLLALPSWRHVALSRQRHTARRSVFLVDLQREEYRDVLVSD